MYLFQFHSNQLNLISLVLNEKYVINHKNHLYFDLQYLILLLIFCLIHQFFHLNKNKNLKNLPSLNKIKNWNLLHSRFSHK